MSFCNDIVERCTIINSAHGCTHTHTHMHDITNILPRNGGNIKWKRRAKKETIIFRRNNGKKTFFLSFCLFHCFHCFTVRVQWNRQCFRLIINCLTANGIQRFDSVERFKAKQTKSIYSDIFVTRFFFLHFYFPYTNKQRIRRWKF